jgi:hypothetical protein
LGELSEVSEIGGRFVFYGNSVFHTAPTNVEGAIATDKSPLLPGGTATVENYTSYVHGINGIVVDISGLPGTPTLADFVFKTGNTNSPESWTEAPSAEEVSVVAGAGTNGADRIIITWADGSITGTWLEITVLAGPNTGLANDDVFYFGNAVAEGSGPSNGSAQVDPADEIGARNHPHGFGNRATIDDIYDYNRDRLVDPIDQILARNNQTGFLSSLRMISVPAAAGLSPGARAIHSVPEPATSSHVFAGGVALLGALLARVFAAIRP